MKWFLSLIVSLALIVGGTLYYTSTTFEQQVQEVVKANAVHGIAIKEIKSEKSLLETNKSFEIFIDDHIAFHTFLQNALQQPFKQSIEKEVFEGLRLQSNIRFSHNPFSETTGQAYLKTLPTTLKQELQNTITERSESAENAKMFLAFIQDKGLLVNFTAKIASKYISFKQKDINLALKDVHLKLLGYEGEVTFNSLYDYDFNANIKTLALIGNTLPNKFHLKVNNVNLKALVSDFYEGDSSFKVQNIDIFSSKKEGQIFIKELLMNTKSSKQENYLDVNIKIALQELENIQQQQRIAKVQNVNLDIDVKKLLATVFEKIYNLSYNSPAYEQKLFAHLATLLENGFEYNINDLSVQNIHALGMQDMGGFVASLHTNLKAQNLNTSSPLTLMATSQRSLPQYSNASASINIDKKLYDKLVQQGVINPFIATYFKQENNKAVLKAAYNEKQQQALYVNGKRLK